jgi:hypothetical protein
MNKRFLPPALALWLAAAAAAWGADTVKTFEKTVAGRIKGMSGLAVTVEPITGGLDQEIPVNEIDVIFYEDEPTLLKTGRTGIDAGRYNDALDALERINAQDITRREILQDLQYYKALCKAKMALNGEGDIMAAGKAMADWVKANDGNYHYLAGCEVVGDLLVAAGKYDVAEPYYGQLAKVRWPDYQMRAGVKLGEAQLAAARTADKEDEKQKSLAQALKSFDAVLGMQAGGALAEAEKLAATLGKARCLAEGGKADEAVALATKVIAQGNPEDHELHSGAYTALGIAHRKAGNTKDALLAFLHVDVLYHTSPRDHIEALRNLVDLWNEVQKPERAAEAAAILRERYNRSP